MLGLSHHLGAARVMSPGRIQDPEGAKHLVVSYQSTAGATTTIIRGRFPLMAYKDVLTGRLRVEERMTVGDLRNPTEGSKKLLIYTTNIRHRL